MRRSTRLRGALCCCAAVSSVLSAPVADAAPVFIAPNGTGGYNAYEIVTAAAPLNTAFSNAAGRTFPGAESVNANGTTGHVVTVRNTAHNNLLNTVRGMNLGGASMWIGAAADPTIVPGSGPNSNTSGNPLPPAGQEPTAGQRGFGFKWQSGEPFNYQNWAPGEPNHFGTGEVGAEMRNDGLWNDNGPPSNAGLNNTYIVEYNLNLPSRPTLALPAAQAGAFNVRMYHNVGQQVDSTRKAQAIVRSPGAATVTDATSPTINFKDPGAEGGAGRFGAASRAAFPGDTAGDTEDFILIANGVIRIPEGQGGDYTFGFSGDDGSVLRILGANFTQITNKGDGAKAQAFGDTLAFDDPTGDSNVLGVVNLAPGDYALEYEFFERAGGAFTELYAAKGVFSDRNDAAFRLIGDTANGGLQLVAVPEPGTFALLGVAAAAACRRRARR